MSKQTKKADIQETPKTHYLKDYVVPDFLVEKLDLTVALDPNATKVKATLQVAHNPLAKHQDLPTSLTLQGDDLTLMSVEVNGTILSSSEYERDEKQLTIFNLPRYTQEKETEKETGQSSEHYKITTIVKIVPKENTSLTGLYQSGKLLCTQCEPEGFRKITYYLDRSDVMARFTTTIIADKSQYPVLLSNGNKIASKDLPEGKHLVTWADPFKKPSYLFALIAGDLVCLKDTFVTKSGRKVAIEFYVEPQNQDKCDHAISSLKKAMAWDEEVYGLEYDLDIYMVVAVNDFNMGAMENKGLNVFNAKYVLADNQTATDLDFQNIESVIAHEYFHNWTGNRVTLRDWFALSLKEGLTVFREQQFSGDMGSRAVKRIQDANLMRTRQFSEDRGPMAHPVRPASYIEINNFYTMTVYYKGAEVIRMLHTLLGQVGFRQGMDLYFKRHDGMAVTNDDFLSAMEDANPKVFDFQQFSLWYTQAGTPKIKAKGEFFKEKKEYHLTFSQSLGTSEKTNTKPFLIPLQVSLISEKGEVCELEVEPDYIPPPTEVQVSIRKKICLLDKPEKTFVFENMSKEPIPSLLGDFSAPVKVDYPYSFEQLGILASYAPDPFARWDASQQLAMQAVMALLEKTGNSPENNPKNNPENLNQMGAAFEEGEEPFIVDTVVSSYRAMLEQKHDDLSLLACILSLPSFDYIAESMDLIPVASLLSALKFLRHSLATKLSEHLLPVYQQCVEKKDNTLSEKAMGARALKNVCLSYLCRTEQADFLEMAYQQFETSQNMTDCMGALQALNPIDCTQREKALSAFYEKWQKVPLVVNKWLSLQATAPLPNTLDKVKALLSHPAYDHQNPNNIYALIGSFGVRNPDCFHDKLGKGYEFMAEQVLKLNNQNPQMAASMVENLIHWKRYSAPWKDLMKTALYQVAEEKNLSKNVFEMVSKALG